MKKILIMLTALMLSMSMTGCGEESEKTSPASDNSVESQETTTETAAETTDEKVNAEISDEEANAENSDEEVNAEVVEEEAEQNVIFALNGPLGRHQSPEEFDNASIAASFDKANLIKSDDGTFSLTLMIHRYELFNGDDINALKKGDIIYCLGEEVVIQTIETRDDGSIVINDGIENGGRVLRTDDNSVYYESGMNARKSYYEIGENTYTLAENFVFTDNSNPDSPATYTAEEFFASDSDVIGFNEANTIVDITDGVITAIERIYIP